MPAGAFMSGRNGSAALRWSQLAERGRALRLAQAIMSGSDFTARGLLRFPAQNDNRLSSRELDQFYTRPKVAARCYRIFREHFSPDEFLMVEPSAGKGAFFRLLPPGSRGYDLEPRCPGVETRDFFSVEIVSDRKVAVIGNPPYGKRSDLAVRFFNHAARQCDVIAFIVPRTFRKAWLVNKLDRSFHLVREEVMPSNAFTFQGRPANVPAVFQIWERRPERRALISRQTTHPDFEFVSPENATVVIRRIGARAGWIHPDKTVSESSHYFIAGDVDRIMRELEPQFRRMAQNTAGCPSLAKAEIVSIYQAHVAMASNAWSARSLRRSP